MVIVQHLGELLLTTKKTNVLEVTIKTFWLQQWQKIFFNFSFVLGVALYTETGYVSGGLLANVFLLAIQSMLRHGWRLKLRWVR